MAWGRRALAGVAAAALLGAVIVVLVVDAADERSARPPAGGEAPAGSHARFAFLASKSSNQCGLQATGITHFAGRHRLQGSCCSPMDEHSYREQVRRLRAHRSVRQIPRDPYDIPAALVKRLFGYDRGISLTGAKRRTYARAMAISDQKGPCCCPCSRWTAFRGLSKLLIAERKWRPGRLATLIDDLEGCGGPRHHHARAT